MSRRAVALVFVSGLFAVGCAAATDTPTADPEAMRLDPPVTIVEEPAEPPEEVAAQESEQQAALTEIARDPDTEVVTFEGEDADPGMADEITAAPKRENLPSMMSGIIKGPNK
ncbi:MAG: hypothetical protein AAF799_21295 [Myxococcota bacterium]